MTEAVWLGPKHFASACDRAIEAGLTIDDAAYNGRLFGYWSIDVSRKGLRPHRITWEGRDRWVVVEVQASDGSWSEKWTERKPTQQTVDEFIGRLLA